MKRGGISENALVSATTHMVGQSRAFKGQVEGWLKEIGSLNDERAAAVLRSLRTTLTEHEQEGTVSYLERTATGLLRTLREEGEDDS
jgi:hypothetical protein